MKKTIEQKKRRIAEIAKELQSLMYEIGADKPEEGRFGLINVWNGNGTAPNHVESVCSGKDNIVVEF